MSRFINSCSGEFRRRTNGQHEQWQASVPGTPGWAPAQPGQGSPRARSRADRANMEPYQPPRRSSQMEYLVTMTTHVPPGTPDKAVDDVRAREAAHTRDPPGRGPVLRRGPPPLAPGEWRTLGLFAAAGAAD